MDGLDIDALRDVYEGGTELSYFAVPLLIIVEDHVAECDTRLVLQLAKVAQLAAGINLNQVKER